MNFVADLIGIDNMTLAHLNDWITQLSTLDKQPPTVIYEWRKLYIHDMLETIVDLGYPKYLVMVAFKTNGNANYESMPMIICNIYQVQLMDDEYYQSIRQLMSLLEEKEEEIEKTANQTIWKCLLCKKNQSNLIHLPCGHIIHCKTCMAERPILLKCTVCDSPIEESCVIYI